jgi:hypothetical protein
LLALKQTDLEATALALEYLNYSNRNIYLTGKAGTGKTTFLKNLEANCQKSFIVVAPTGVAALNAGGVTIHSQFLFPLGSFLPEGSAIQFPHLNFFDRSSLSRRHNLNSSRKQVLQGIDLLIIDEVSMCRADILDAIDFRLQQARRISKPFGGVQLLMIGDLYQLPPIVQDQDWEILRAHYKGMHFFNSKALQSSGFVQVELKKVYRQKDAQFVELLNKIRQQNISDSDLEFLNQATTKSVPETAIHLVTHRNQAEALNQKRLGALKTQSFSYSASIRGDFPERMYPIPEKLDLKVGARVMFLKNDSEEGAYYNGKIAEVVDLDKEHIWVKMDDHDRFEVRKDTWKNARYKVSEEDQSLKEELLGEFSHFPLRLAWAITIHKSQGLSFDEAVINLGRAFAPGQAYVALTRLRSFEGLYLSAPLSRSALITDLNARVFSSEQEEIDPHQFLDSAKQAYQIDYFLSCFDFRPMAYTYKDFFQDQYQKLQLDKTGFKNRFSHLENQIGQFFKYAGSFQKQIWSLHQKDDQAALEERLLKARDYFLPALQAALSELQTLKLEYAARARTKQLVQAFEVPIKAGFELYLGLLSLREAWQFFKAEHETSPAAQKLALREKAWEEILEKVPKPKYTPKKGGKSKKGETYRTTFQMIKSGMRPAAIATARELTIGTIYSHCLKGLKEDALELEEILEPERIEFIAKHYQADKEQGAYQWHQDFPEIKTEEWRLYLYAVQASEQA